MTLVIILWFSENANKILKMGLQFLQASVCVCPFNLISLT